MLIESIVWRKGVAVDKTRSVKRQDEDKSGNQKQRGVFKNRLKKTNNKIDNEA